MLIIKFSRELLVIVLGLTVAVVTVFNGGTVHEIIMGCGCIAVAFLCMWKILTKLN